MAFETADPFDPAFRSRNPLGKVPALLFTGGAACLETTLICRALMAMGDTLLPQDIAEAIELEADVALFMGMLDLGVAHRLESLRTEEHISPKWQARRIEGLRAALPLVEAAAGRAREKPQGYAAAALTVTLDWLDFRMAEHLDWRAECPTAATLLPVLLTDEIAGSTDPRVG